MREQESWDDELELEAKYDELGDNAELRCRDEEEGPVPSLLGRGVLRFLHLHLPILPYPRMPFLPSNNQHPSPDLFFILQRPVYSPFQTPSTPIHHRLLLFTVSSLLDVRLCSVTPSAFHTQRTRGMAVKEEEPSAQRGGSSWLT